MTETILIAGGGIGGLAAAIALGRAGFAVRLFEARTEPDEAGAGIQLGANAVKALRYLGLEAQIRARSRPAEAIELRLPLSGRLVSRVALGATHEARYGAPYLHLHRGDLHRILFDAALSVPSVEIVLGRRVTAISQSSQHAMMQLDTGAEIDGDALIGADGVRSVARESVAGHDQPHFTGMMAWRTIVPATPEELARPPVSTIWMGPGRHLVTYPLVARQAINLVGVVEQSTWTEEAWSLPGTAAEMQADFAGWHDDIDTLLGRIETPWRWALYERRPLSTWCAGRTALLGDACHAMPPFLAQGAAMALEDAVVLARAALARKGDLPHALRHYSDARRERTSQVQRASWANAWRFHLRQRMTRFAVYGALGALSRIAPSRPMRMYDWLYSYDPATA